MSTSWAANGTASTHYSHSSWSHDGVHWHPIAWQKNSRGPGKSDTLLFPEFTEDQVYFGHQVPMSYENVVERMEQYGKHPHARVHVLGKSLEGRQLYRLEITDPEGPHPRKTRWVHYFANQHPGEHNSQWRMVGMIDWLLSDAGTDCRRRSICHFVLMSSPDGPAHGWYPRQPSGRGHEPLLLRRWCRPTEAAHEACVLQTDLQVLMASPCPVTDIWSMHTWAGIVEPLLLAGPEMGTTLGPWTDLRDAIERHDPRTWSKHSRFAKRAAPRPGTAAPTNSLASRPSLCEGAGDLYTKQENLDSGVVLMQGIAEYYKGTKKSK